MFLAPCGTRISSIVGIICGDVLRNFDDVFASFRPNTKAARHVCLAALPHPEFKSKPFNIISRYVRCRTAIQALFDQRLKLGFGLITVEEVLDCFLHHFGCGRIRLAPRFLG